MAEVFTRQKEIQYSSRTRANTDRFREQHELRHNIDNLLKKLPEKIKELPEVKLLSKEANSNVYNIVHLIYHNREYEGYSKDFEFSRLGMEIHWQAGYDDTMRTLKNPQVLKRPNNRDGVAIFDMCRQEHTPEMSRATKRRRSN
jgi:NTE family protein